MINIFIGNKVAKIGFRVSEDAKKAISNYALEKGFANVTDYILTLIDKDMKEGLGHDK